MSWLVINSKLTAPLWFPFLDEGKFTLRFWSHMINCSENSCSLLTVQPYKCPVVVWSQKGPPGGHNSGKTWSLGSRVIVGSMLRVLVVLVVGWVVGWQRWSIYARMVESAVVLVPAASLHHEVTTHGSLGHVWEEETMALRSQHTSRGSIGKRRCNDTHNSQCDTTHVLFEHLNFTWARVLTFWFNQCF